VASLTGWQTPAAGALLIAGNAIGLWQAAQIAHPRRGPGNVILVGVLLLTPLLLAFREAPPLAAILLLLAQVFSLTLGMFIFLGAGGAKGNKGLLRTTLMHGFGQIFFVLLVFVYYSSYDIDFGFRSGILRPVAAALATLFITLAHMGKREKVKSQKANFSPALLATALLVIPLALLLTWKTPLAKAALSGTRSIRVMDYNLHDAVNEDGRLDPEALALQIESSGAELIGLQEISRGWLVWGGLDMLSWLSQRLNIPYIWAPTADPQWGLAIFSRYPILRADYIPLPPDDVPLLRGHILAEIDIDGQTLTVIDTHFSEKDSQDEIRVIQASAILSTWNHNPATVIMGDFNAIPESMAIQLLLDGGLIDISREIGQQPILTSSAIKPEKQIDYIFVSPDMGFSDFVIPITTASDHFPLVTTITMP